MRLRVSFFLYGSSVFYNESVTSLIRKIEIFLKIIRLKISLFASYATGTFTCYSTEAELAPREVDTISSILQMSIN